MWCKRMVTGYSKFKLCESVYFKGKNFDLCRHFNNDKNSDFSLGPNVAYR